MCGIRSIFIWIKRVIFHYLTNILKNSNLFLGFGLVLITVAILLYYLLEDSGRNALLTGALFGLGLITSLLGLVGKRKN